MSGKRRATSDLNHDNWDQEDEPEIAGTFQKAPLNIIQKRVIRTAKRRSGASSEQTDGPKTIFAGFGGFGAGGVGLKSGNSSSDTFSFLKNTTPVTTNGSQLGNKIETNPSSPLSNEQSLNKDKKTASSDDTDSKKYPSKLIHLNQAVSHWITECVDKDPACVLSPIFSDYEKYLKQIEDEAGATEKGSEKSMTSPFTNFKFESKCDSRGGEKPPSSQSIFSSFKSDVKTSPISTLLSKPDPASLMVNPFTTKLNSPEEKSGGKKDNEVKTEIKPFSFGNPQQASAPATGFTFGSSKPYTFGNVTSPEVNSKKTEDLKTEGETEESEDPPKPDFKPVQEEDAVYSKRCKVFIKKESGYADLGIGTLFVKPVPGEKHQLLVRADTSLGNILVNVLLTSAIPLQRMAKNNVMMICVPTPPPAGAQTPPPSTVLLRVKTSEEADQLLANLENYRK